MINTEEWIDFFIKKLKVVFSNNKINLECEKEIKSNNSNKEFFIIFRLNGSIKKFKLIVNKNSTDMMCNSDCIFMCTPNTYEDNIYWLELLNDVNILKMFYSFLVNEINNMNKKIYRSIDIFEGIDEKHISEIFDNSIRNYYIKKEKKIIDFDREQISLIKKYICSENFRSYGVEFEVGTLWIVKNGIKIEFLCIKDGNLVEDDIIDHEISILYTKLLKKLSEYKKLVMFKENNILDNSLKIISKISVFFSPLVLIVYILSILNFNIIYFKNLKLVLYIILIFLSVVQFSIINIILRPSIKASRFKWKIQ